mgnify:CR=1 FL=1
MSKNNISFILHKPQLSENIGACARAIKNFNFKKLILINPKPIFPNDKILATSVGAKDVVKQSKKYDNLEKAISKIDIVIATSARFRNKNIKHINLDDLKKINFKKKIGFLFGSEASGPNKKATFLLKSILFNSFNFICLIFLFLNLEVVEIKKSIFFIAGSKLS